MKTPYAKCNECTLIDKPFVSSKIHDGAKVILLGEAPGKDEVIEGEPFVGKAGKDLNEITNELGYNRKDFNYLNSVCCRPIKEFDRNRAPTTKEIDCCNVRLKCEIDQINPKAIVTLGRTAYTALTHVSTNITELIGTSFEWYGYKIFITYHPAAITYAGGTKVVKGSKIKESIKDAINEAMNIKEKCKVITAKQMELPL